MDRNGNSGLEFLLSANKWFGCCKTAKAANQNNFGNMTFHTVSKYCDTIEYPFNAVLWVHDIVAHLVKGNISEGVDSSRLVGYTTLREYT